MKKITRNDQVIVTVGKDKGRRGKVISILTNGKLLIEGINLAKKHQKGNPSAGVPGGIIEKEMPVDASNVMLVNPVTDKADRVGFKTLEDGKKVRFFKSSGAVIN